MNNKNYSKLVFESAQNWLRVAIANCDLSIISLSLEFIFIWNIG